MWRHKGFTNPYGKEWYMSSCQHQYRLGETYEEGYNDCLNAVVQYLEDGLDKKELAEIEKRLQTIKGG